MKVKNNENDSVYEMGMKKLYVEMQNAPAEAGALEKDYESRRFDNRVCSRGKNKT